MDTKQVTPQIPELQLAKVGDKRRKKGGAFWLSGSGAAGRSGGGGIWGSLSGMMSQSALKIVVTLLAGTVGVGAYHMGKSLRPDDSQFERKPQLFASKNEKPKYEGDLSKLPGGTGSGQNSVTMVSGSLDGLTAEERAAKAAKAEADAKAAAEAQAKADAEAQAKEQANVPGAASPDALAEAQAAAAAKEKAAAFKERFGKLSQGSGLSGGPGMAGGVAQGFSQLKANQGASGVLSTLGSKRAGAGSSSSRVSAGRNPGRSLAQRQLNRAAQGAKQMRAGANETRSDTARVPFDTGSGESQMLTGAGGGTGSGPRSGARDSSPSSGGGGSGSPVGVGGNSGAGGSDDCGTLASQYGWHGNFVNSADGGCVLKDGNVAGTGKDDPTNQYFDMLKILSIIAAVLGGLLMIAAALQYSDIPATVAIGLMMAKICGGLLCAVGAIIALLGLMVVGMGRKLEGGIFAGMGILESIAGYMAYSAADKASADVKTAETTTTNSVQKLTAEAWNKSFLATTNTSLIGGGAAAATGTGSAIYGNNIDPRTWHPDTQRWE